MSETQITVQEQQFDAPTEWGDREEVKALAGRIRQLLPGKLGPAEAMLLAQYSAAMDANPFRGEVYAFQDKGKVVLVEGYKLLVRWARRQCNFYERYERITNETDTIPEGSIAFRCRILRDDAVQALATLTTAGVPNAYEICSVEAVGVVKRSHRPPEGWTVEDVARKRALKNALNRAYGAPSPREIAAETWMVDDTETGPEDWAGEVSEAEAKYNAQARQRVVEHRPAQRDVGELWGSPPEPESVVEVTTAPQGSGDSPWHKRTELIAIACQGIPYYTGGPHILNALKKLEAGATIKFTDGDDICLAALQTYAQKRADEKAA